MATTPFKGLELQVTGSNVDSWGTVLNDSDIAIVDVNMAALFSKLLGGSNYTMTATEARNVMLRFTGTLTANVQITNPAQGFYFVENLTTDNFTLTVTNGVGSAVTIPQSTRCAIFADTNNGCRIFSISNITNPVSVPTGTRMLFTSSAVPTGWTLVDLSDDSGLQVVTSTGGAISGSVAYSTLFARTATDGHTLTTAEIPAHSHDINSIGTAGTGGVDGAAHWSHRSSVDGSAIGTTDAGTGGQSAAHTHPLDLQVLTVTVLCGERSD